jgi:hypothetical protein
MKNRRQLSAEWADKSRPGTKWCRSGVDRSGLVRLLWHIPTDYLSERPRSLQATSTVCRGDDKLTKCGANLTAK